MFLLSLLILAAYSCLFSSLLSFLLSCLLFFVLSLILCQPYTAASAAETALLSAFLEEEEALLRDTFAVCCRGKREENEKEREDCFHLWCFPALIRPFSSLFFLGWPVLLSSSLRSLCSCLCAQTFLRYYDADHDGAINSTELCVALRYAQRREERREEKKEQERRERKSLLSFAVFSCWCLSFLFSRLSLSLLSVSFSSLFVSFLQCNGSRSFHSAIATALRSTGCRQNTTH